MFLFLKRTLKTSEIIISRVFLSGCGWNGGSMIAENLDYSIVDYNFFFITGCCQALSVMSGHLTYSKLKNRFRKINMDLEYNKAFHIGSATFLSGCIWQPTVNLFDTYEFSVVSTVTGLTCGATFFTGLLISFPVIYFSPYRKLSEVIPITWHPCIPNSTHLPSLVIRYIMKVNHLRRTSKAIFK